jgi:hypothetical protein
MSPEEKEKGLIVSDYMRLLCWFAHSLLLIRAFQSKMFCALFNESAVN